MPAKPTSQTVDGYLASLPADRRKEIERIRTVVKKNLPAGYKETMSGKMLAWVVPLEKYADTYNGQALWYAALASQKTGLSLHLMPLYRNAANTKKLTDAFKARGTKPDMGQACIRFKSADDLPLDTIGEIVGSIPMNQWIEIAKSAWGKRK